MINTQKISSQIAANAPKNDAKLSSKDKEKLSTKDALSQALKQNLTPSDIDAEEVLQRFSQNQTGEKLKALVNKLLEQLGSGKNSNSPVIKQGNYLNFAPNFANELKNLSTELGKNEVFKEVLQKLEQILKPASEVKAGNLAPLFKNSGVFLEAKLKDALNEELLPKSFHTLLSTIKSLGNEKLATQIAELGSKDLNPKESLNALKELILQNKGENKQILQESGFKALLNLGQKIENFKNYIGKNPILAENKILQMSDKIFKELSNVKADFFKALSKPENLVLKDTTNLKELARAFEKLENTLKNILTSHGKVLPQNKNHVSLEQLLQNKMQNIQNASSDKALPQIKENIKFVGEEKHFATANKKIEYEKNDPKIPLEENLESEEIKLSDKSIDKDNVKNNDKEGLKESENSANKKENTSKENTSKENINENEAKDVKNTANKENINTKENNSNKENAVDKENNPKENMSKENVKENPKDNANVKDNLKENSKDNANLKDNSKENVKDLPKEQVKNEVLKDIKNLDQKEPKATQNQSNTQNQNLQNQSSQNTTQSLNQAIRSEEFFKQNLIKNLAFSTENGDLTELESLSKDLSLLTRKINENLKQLEPHSQNAKLNLNELKNLEHKLTSSLKDLNNIKNKSEQDIASEIRHDVKSTLLQISNLAKEQGNEAVFNGANRLLAQIEINQLMSLANDSINTYLPFFWEDLSDSKVVFRRGKKDKFFTQIKLEFAHLGELEVLISLNNEKYIDINIMAENTNFRRTIYENAHELKRNINKAGLLSANFFVGDIIRSKFDTRGLKNYDLQMGMDKSV